MSKPKPFPRRAIAIAIMVPKSLPGVPTMRKEIGMPKNAPKAAKKADDKMDKDKGIKEGSKTDLKVDKKIMKSYGKKGK